MRKEMKLPHRIVLVSIAIGLAAGGSCLGMEKKPLDPRPEAVEWQNYIVRKVREGDFRKM